MNNHPSQPPIICIHEDRPTHLIGVKLAVLSILDHNPNLSIIVSCPHPPASFQAWVDKHKNVKLISYPELTELGWNVKPAILLQLLESGYSEITWMDSDIIANGDILSRLTDYSDDTLVVTQETFWGHKQSGNFRTAAWKLPIGRKLPCTINSGIIRVTVCHIPVLKAWQNLMDHPAYVEIQALPWEERPVHMLSDQDALTALMGSTQFAETPLVMLKRGRDIAQCFGASGYTPADRIRNLFTGLPPLIHAMDFKPWTRPVEPPKLFGTGDPFRATLREYYDYLSLELSPYNFVALKYRDALEDETDWMEVRSWIGRLLKFLTGGSPIMIGFPLSLFETTLRGAFRAWKTARSAISRKTEINNPL